MLNGVKLGRTSCVFSPLQATCIVSLNMRESATDLQKNNTCLGLWMYVVQLYLNLRP